MDSPLKSAQIASNAGHCNNTETVSPPLQVDGKWFRDQHGRVCLLRGVNLSGACKMPHDQTSHTTDLTAFFDQHRQVSFVGRPFPINEMDEHFERLKSWGFLFLRFQITWEALEHAGPGKYDEEYFDYLATVLKRAGEHGFRCFLDPHQDVWSRFTGGSGAPGWTIELVGFDMKQFRDTEAALVQNTFPNPGEFPRMIWPTNYYKLACATMFTLFFAGNQFAPKCLVEQPEDTSLEPKMHLLTDSEFEDYLHDMYRVPRSRLVNIQDFLQSCYFNAVRALIRRLSKEPGLLNNVVAGYDTLNEPSGGFLGHTDISKIDHHQELRNGLMPTPLESMLLGEGVPTEIERYKFTWSGPRRAGSVMANSNGVRCWFPGSKCVWLAHGVYDKNTRKAVKPDYFSRHPKTGRKIEWVSDYWKPFVRQFTCQIRLEHSHAIIFIEPPVNEPPPAWRPEEGDPDDRICYTPHWYDGITLMNKQFSSLWTLDYIGYKRGLYWSILGALSFGRSGIHRNFTRQLGLIREEGLKYLGPTPCLIGEIGIPFDMDKKRAYEPNGSYKPQLQAMDANMTALERNLLNFTLWNYCPDNNHQWGDNWNGEDLSLWSPDGLPDCPFEPISDRECSKLRRDRSLQRTVMSLLRPESRSNDSAIATSIHTVSPITTNKEHSTSPATPSTSNILQTHVLEQASIESLSRRTSIVDGRRGSNGHFRSQTTPDTLLHSSLPMRRFPLEELARGARALDAFLRPYPMFTAGTPIHLSFDYASKERTFRFRFQNAGHVEASAHRRKATEIFLPFLHFGYPIHRALHGEIKQISEPESTSEHNFFDVQVSDGEWTYDADMQVLHYYHCEPDNSDHRRTQTSNLNENEHEVVVTRLSRRQVMKRLNGDPPKQSACLIS